MARTAQENPGRGPAGRRPDARRRARQHDPGGRARRRRRGAALEPEAHRADRDRGARRRLAGHQGDRRSAALRRRHAQRHDARGAVLRRRERLHADLRPDARRQHGARLAVPARRLPRARDAGQVVQERAGGRRARPVAVGRHRHDLLAARLDHPADPRDGDHRRDRRAPAAGLPALELGPGPAPGADHDRPLGDPRRPDARGVRRHLQGHQDADGLAGQHQPARRRALRVLPRGDRARHRRC